MRNLFADRFCLALLADWGANGQDNSHEQTTKNHQPTKQLKSGNSSKNGWIVTKQATYLRVVGLLPTDQTIGQTQARVTNTPFEVRVDQRSGPGARGLEPARGQKPTAEALKIQEVRKVDIGK